MAKILVIDDSGFQRRSICKIIESLGHDTIQAENGQDALNQLQTLKVDCIFCDLLMPDVNGHQFLEAYAWKDEAAPVIVLSADKQESSYDMSIELGAKAMINKPAKLDKIEMALSKVLN
ncbi:response regulator [Opacimonas viscosa]|jgi:CheY-like chemotaxis protein|uniref:Response regulator n=1 Tax=Opacimonas viscosa TaxID=2961944 RepID=A0AA41WZ46_9ALTE|nr:response regulator [Opacimonas viscosa]MCP3429184.1 response regulator [Opacimonas viscosa]